MEMDATCDAYSYVDELYKELRPIYKNIEREFAAKLRIVTVFRLLHSSIGRPTRVSFTKADQTLWIDLVVLSEIYDPLKKCEQRHQLSKDHFEVLAAAIRKYKFKDLDPDDFLNAYERGLVEIGWRKEDWEVAMEAADM